MTINEDEMLEWKDTTSYPQGETDRTPRAWSTLIGPFHLSVYRGMYESPDVWLATCHGVFTQRVLASKNIDEAKCQAEAMLQVMLENALAAILK